jgi:hypothetical protein
VNMIELWRIFKWDTYLRCDRDLIVGVL